MKAKNGKQRTRALRVRVGGEVGGWYTFEKGLPVVDHHSMSDEPNGMANCYDLWPTVRLSLSNFGSGTRGGFTR